MDFHFRAFCILQYIEKKQILLHMPFVKCLKVLKIFIRAFSLFARHGRALTGVSPEHAQIVGNV